MILKFGNLHLRYTPFFNRTPPGFLYDAKFSSSIFLQGGNGSLFLLHVNRIYLVWPEEVGNVVPQFCNVWGFQIQLMSNHEAFNGEHLSSTQLNFVKGFVIQTSVLQLTGKWKLWEVYLTAFWFDYSIRNNNVQYYILVV